MGTTLVAAREPHGTLRVNAWNWQPTLALLRRADLLPPDVQERADLRVTVSVEADDAAAVARYLAGYLAGRSPGERIFLDGSITDEPDTYEFFREDLGKNYSATYEWLCRFRDFRRTSDGFEIG